MLLFSTSPHTILVFYGHTLTRHGLPYIPLHCYPSLSHGPFNGKHVQAFAGLCWRAPPPPTRGQE